MVAPSPPRSSRRPTPNRKRPPDRWSTLTPPRLAVMIGSRSTTRQMPGAHLQPLGDRGRRGAAPRTGRSVCQYSGGQLAAGRIRRVAARPGCGCARGTAATRTRAAPPARATSCGGARVVGGEAWPGRSARAKPDRQTAVAMRVLTIIHQDDAGPGVFANVPGADLVPWKADREPAPAVDAVGRRAGARGRRQRGGHRGLSVAGRETCAWSASCSARRVPTLGVCLGAQLVAEAAGGLVQRAPVPEIGWYEVGLEAGAEDDPLFEGLPERFVSFQWHSYVAVPPAGSAPLARSEHCLQGFRLADAPAWGIQFHAEVSAADAAPVDPAVLPRPGRRGHAPGPGRAPGRERPRDAGLERAGSRPIPALPGLRS